MSKLYAEAAKKDPQQAESTEKAWGDEGASKPWRPSAQAPVFRPASAQTTQPSVVAASKPAPSQTKTHGNANKNPGNQGAQPSKISKKRKPSLQTMSIGDLLPKSIPVKTKATASKGPHSPSPQQPRQKQTQNVLDSSAFPALSDSFPALPTAAKKPKAAPPPTPQPRKKPNSIQYTAKHVSRQTASKPKASKAVVANSAIMGSIKANLTSPSSTNDRNELGAEHDLLRLMQQGKMAVKSKGRQRIRPRKKKFTSLKKKVLEERLRKWRESHPEEAPPEKRTMQTFTVCVYGYASQEELEDDDEYQEIVSNLHDMASKIGTVRRIYVPQSIENWTGEKWPAFVEFEESKNVEAAISCWDGLVVGGESLDALPIASTNRDAPPEENEWRDWCLTTERSCAGGNDVAMQDADGRAEVVIDNVLTEDDLEDDECLEETVSDIKSLAERFGTVEDVRVEKEPCARLIVAYRESASVAEKAATELGKQVIGGTKISAKVLTSEAPDEQSASCSIILMNVLTEDDLEDEECLEESLNDVRELAKKFGSVLDVILDSESSDPGAVRIRFSGARDVAQTAIDGFAGMVIGGSIVHATFPETGKTDTQPAGAVQHQVEEEPTPLFSGDKLIPERFAECKRVPKIPNSGAPRHYAVITNDESVKPLLVEMLGELMRLQRRAIEDKNAKARRRLVMGLREVARGIRAHKVKMVVMANNLDEYGVLDEKLQEILDLARDEDIPVFFEFSKRGLGKAIGKKIKIGVVGVQNVDGAHQQFKKLVKLAPSIVTSSVDT